MKKLDPQPNVVSYYKSYEEGKIIPTKFAVPVFLELNTERSRNHIWMKITKSKRVDYVGLMENKMRDMGDEMINLSIRKKT